MEMSLHDVTSAVSKVCNLLEMAYEFAVSETDHPPQERLDAVVTALEIAKDTAITAEDALFSYRF